MSSVTIFRIQLTQPSGQSTSTYTLDKDEADSLKAQFEAGFAESGLDASATVIVMQTTTDS